MRASRLLLPTLRDDPADAVAASHRLLVRAGYVRQVGSGLWSFMPLGYRTLTRTMQVIREEMDAIGCQELLMPVMHPEDLWRQTGRNAIPELFKLQDRKGSELVLAMTHEETIALHAAAEIRSYRDLPQCWYQLQTKERDEPRPQGGLLRTREFIMKDAYSLDRDPEGLQASYDAQAGAYRRIFDRLGLRFYEVESDVGMMGGSAAMEYMAPSPAGEDRIALSEDGSYAANVELAVSRASVPDFGPSEPIREIETPGITTIEQLAEFVGRDPRLTAKSVIVVPEDDRGGVVLALVRGDHRAHDLKLTRAISAPFRPATPEEIRATFGAEPGSIGAVGLQEGQVREVIVDPVLTEGAYLTGANRTDWHLHGAEFGRDFTGRVVDIRHVEEGELSVETGSPLRIEPAIEVGNIFQLGTRYAEALGATYLDENGTEQLIWMGSYGIGPARTVAAIAEQCHDDDGLVWPPAVSPYDVWITPIGEAALAFADELDRELTAEGAAVVVDDRDLSPGVRFADADLIGVPVRVTVGKKLEKDGIVSVKRRGAGDEANVPAADAVAEIRARLS
ncbi:MAG: proline--tRNA ligase [Gemmatimonadetes bacterium]|nr:proline--tRNA ligase [Gemmatimonadota bacterium]